MLFSVLLATVSIKPPNPLNNNPMWWSPHWGFRVDVVVYHCHNKIPSKVLQHNSYLHTAFMCRILKLVWI